MSATAKVIYVCEHLGRRQSLLLQRVAETYEIQIVELQGLRRTSERATKSSRVSVITLFDGVAGTATGRQIASAIRVVLDRIQPTVVVVEGWSAPEALAALQWCKLTRTPVIVHSDTNRHDQNRIWWKEGLKQRLVRLYSAGFVAGTQSAAYLASLGMPSERIVTGCYAVDNEYFKNGSAVIRASRCANQTRLSLPLQFFLAAMRFIEKKNIVGLLRAYQGYREKAGADSWGLVIIGDGPDRERVHRIRAELDLETSVVMPGYVRYKELPTWYGLASAFVHPSTQEPWGLVVNEAMAAGLPVIVSNRCGCASDLVVHGHNGFKFDPYDEAELGRQMHEIAHCRLDIEDMGRLSQEIIARWSPDTYAECFWRAAELAMSAPLNPATFADRSLLWGLVRRSFEARQSTMVNDLGKAAKTAT